MLICKPMRSRLAVGMAMVLRGEVGLIFVALGRSSNLFDGAASAVLVVVAALTTVPPPLAMKWFYTRYTLRLPA